MKPDIESLAAVCEKFEQMGISYSLGGSGLLLSLGLVNSVRDWDVMTEAPKDRALKALQNYEVEEITSGDYPFGSEYKLFIGNVNPQVEVLGCFSIYSDKGLCRMPSIPLSRWNGIQVGSPEVWYVAYALMDRMDKAALLLSFLKETGANKEILGKLMNEPLPHAILQEIESLNQI
ncbi:hypothetical protein [Paenibacillus planticolens]|uniref:Nucleotidyltransferase family protein n=1 Tax=Paenibacillus planticolens TaxID=2654976 RepID=A0ABX1ZQB6_9BACL|nr:hypothetical protein [Paenibacillus planticolens]NOV02277.1 hypothetical protein [Paenibacillus planticolens]